MQWGILALLSMVMYLPGLLLRYFPFAHLYSERQKRWLWGGQGCLLAINGLLFYVAGVHAGIGIAYGKLCLLVFGMLFTGINILVLRKRWKELLFTSGFTLLIGQCVMNTVVYIMRKTIGLDGAEDYFVGMVAFLVLFAFTMPVWYRILKDSVVAFLKLDHKGYWDTVWFVPLGMFVTCYVAIPSDMYAETIFQLISHYCMLVAGIFVCRRVAGDSYVYRAQLEMQRRLNVQEEYYTQLAEQVERDRKSRHDFKHHMMAIREYIKKDDKEGLNLYCDRLLERNSGETVIPYTGNSAVDGVIYHYALLAKEHNIRFSYPAVCKNPGLQDMDLCVLLGNALDNALAGCLTVEGERIIKVVMQEDEICVRLMISNTFDGKIQKKDDRLLSRKRDNRPGVGLESMRSVCEKYGAAMDIRYDDSEFQVLFVFIAERDQV